MQNKTRSTISHFTHLIAWQKNYVVALEIYKLTRNFQKEEMFGLISQIRRASTSVTANIAEGFGRYHALDKRKFYIQARGSNTELQNHLILAHDLKYINDNEFNKIKLLIFEGYKIICGLINRMETFK